MLDAEALRLKLEKAVRASGGMGKFAEQHVISTALVSLTLSGKRQPNRKIARALGYEPFIRFIPVDDPLTQPSDALSSPAIAL